MERCVQKVKAQGRSKESAIAICFNSVVKEQSIERATKEYEMGKKRQKKKARQKARAEKDVRVQEVEAFVKDFVPDFVVGDAAEGLETFEADGLTLVNGENQLEKEVEDVEQKEEEKEEEKSLHLDDEEGSSHIGPTSWAELDELREAEKRAARVSMVSFDFGSILRNIMRNPFLALGEKVRAIKNAADGIEGRVDEALSTKELKKLDAETLEIMLLSKDAQNETSALEHLQRAKLTSEARANLADSSFALVVERDGQKVRKFPIHNKVHVRNALARAAQQLKLGGSGAADARAALPQIRAAAKGIGIGMPSKKKKNAIVVQKDSEGNWRWIGWVSNNFKDLEGDIISEAAHKEYVGWLDEVTQTKPMLTPEFRVWHTPGTARKSRVDWWSYTNGFLLMSAMLTEKEATSLMAKMLEQDLGMSHGFLVLGRDLQDHRVITKYRTFEVSDLPLQMAANPWTAIETELIQ